MSANYMQLKSSKVFKKAKAITNSTPFKEKTNLVIQSRLNVRHLFVEDCQKKIKVMRP